MINLAASSQALSEHDFSEQASWTVYTFSVCGTISLHGTLPETFSEVFKDSILWRAALTESGSMYTLICAHEGWKTSMYQLRGCLWSDWNQEQEDRTNAMVILICLVLHGLLFTMAFSRLWLSYDDKSCMHSMCPYQIYKTKKHYHTTPCLAYLS